MHTPEGISCIIRYIRVYIMHLLVYTMYIIYQYQVYINIDIINFFNAYEYNKI